MLTVRNDQPIDLLILFDGVCGLCDRTIRFLLRIDKQQKLKFAALQGSTGEAILKKYCKGGNHYKSFILVRHYNTQLETVYLRSDAMIQILRELGGGWRLLSAIHLIPRAIRDWLYDWIAVNRYQWFGKFSECKIPSPDVRERFLP